MNELYQRCAEFSQKMLVVSKKFDSHPAADVEEDIDGDGDGQQQAVEADAPAAAGAALREVLIYCSRVEQPKERHYWDEAHHGGQREHDDRRLRTG